jgi:hypothetical protein
MRRVALIVLFVAGCAAQPKADWTGWYNITRDSKVLGDLKPVNPNLDDVILAHLQPWARAKLEATNGTADDTGLLCHPDGPFRFPINLGNFLILPGPKEFVIVYGSLETAGVERVYLNRPHPKNLLPTWNGDSIGHWEGDTLVTDTIGFNDKSWLENSMMPHSEETHMIQRIRMVPGGLLEFQWIIEDRLALTSAYTYTRYYQKTEPTMPEYICNEDLQQYKDRKNRALKPLVERSREIR